MNDLVWLIPGLPLLGFAFLLVAGRRIGEPLAGWIATGAVGSSFLVAVVTFFDLVGRDEHDRQIVSQLFEWIGVGSFRADAELLVDPLSISMTLFITGVGALIHLYAIGYMHGDEKFSKFFVYLNLFVFSMLMLVLGNNMLITFLGWEGVGACSYFLISFWHADPANATAGKKAFVTNRIGDFGFMLAMFLCFQAVGTINYVDADQLGLATEQVSTTMAAGTATAVTMLLLLAAAGKSAQLPLFVWLPDAMAGPTPVSALIHAATMVTSGVYLLTRLNPIVHAADGWAPTTIAWVGGLTALFAATAAVAQNDIKKVLAYSTVSQLGYMFLAVGLGGYVAAIFHMITHAFFKALLFMGSGSVIHGMHHEQDMRFMGGLRKLMPVTAITFIIGWLAIAGVPPFAGFWSKDEILAYAWQENPILWVIGLLTAILTAFYMTRQVIMTFFGRNRYGEPTPAEVAAAWDAKEAAAEAEVATASDAEEKAVAALEAARTRVETSAAAVPQAEERIPAAEAAVPEAEEAAAAAEAAVAEAEAIVAAAAEDAKEEAEAALASAQTEAQQARARADQSVAAVEASKNAVEAAKTQLSAAEEAVPVAEAAVEDARTEVAARREGVAAVHAERRRDTAVPDMTVAGAPYAVAEVEDHLPEVVAERREFHPHESPWTMLLPLVALSGLAIVGGFIQLPFKGTHFLGDFLHPVVAVDETYLELSGVTKIVLAVIAVAGGLVGIAAAYAVYWLGKADPRKIELPILGRAWGLDEGYAAIVGGPGTALFQFFADRDADVVDASVNGVGALFRGSAARLRGLQTGFVRSYAAAMGLGAVALVIYFATRMSF